MFYYEVAPADRSYQGAELLTYSSGSQLAIGQIIVVMLRTRKVRAIVIKQVTKPSFQVLGAEIITPEHYIPTNHIRLFEWMRHYYAANVGPAATLFMPGSHVKKQKNKQLSDANATTIKLALPKLTNQQQAAYDKIIASPAQTHIVHGDTGTGKTRLYIELARRIITQNKSVIFLTPEISLTPQLSEQLRGTFDTVRLVHSGLTASERRIIWERIETCDQPQIIVGPRSALFYPVKNIGLIVVDEFHDSAYKQEQMPRYNALRIAGQLSRLNQSILLLGSATPPIEDYFYALAKGAEVHRLTEKPNKISSQKNVYIADLRDSSELSTYPLLSKSLLTHMQSRLQKKQQILLYLNKRGSLRSIMCRSCGWHATCSRCNIAYTYHHDEHLLRCHVCSQSMPAPNNCPECHSVEILFKNPGTKSVEQSIRSAFPQAIIGRYDKDNKKNETFSAHHADITAGNIDILIGTQLLVKGHDLPRLGMVGVLLAESSLQFPDYNSSEKSFQLLHQIAGRIGRHDIPGEVFVQTYDPKNEILDYLGHGKNDWTHFYASELQQRKKYNFPPYCHLLKIETARKTEKIAQKNIQGIVHEIEGLKIPNLELLGPAPAYFYKQNNEYHWQLIVKSKSRSDLLRLIKSLPKSCTYDIDPISLL